MADPNITRLSRLNAKNNTFLIPTEDPVLLCETFASQTIKINSLYITNTNVCLNDTRISCYIFDGAVNRHLAKDIVVPVGTSIILIDKESPVYIQEFERIYLSSVVPDAIEGVINYDIMTE